MGKFMMFLGVIILIASIAGMAYGFVAGPLGLTNNIQEAVSSERAAELCNSDETLVEVGGQSEYTPGLGYGRTVLYYCEDAQGNRRDINSEYYNNMFGNITNTVFGFFGPQFGIGMLASFGLGIGIILIVIGSIVNRFRRRDVLDPYGGAAFNISSGIPQVSVNPDFASYNPGQSNPISGMSAMPGANNANLTDRLRQLENARRENLISQSEYERMRKEILDQMR